MFANILIILTMMLLLWRTMIGFQDDLVTRTRDSFYTVVAKNASAATAP